QIAAGEGLGFISEIKVDGLKPRAPGVLGGSHVSEMEMNEHGEHQLFHFIGNHTAKKEIIIERPGKHLHLLTAPFSAAVPARGFELARQYTEWINSGVSGGRQ